MSSSWGGFRFGAILLVVTQANHHLLLLREFLERDREIIAGRPERDSSLMTSLRGSIIFYVM
jgi:hypothetical protein